MERRKFFKDKSLLLFCLFMQGISFYLFLLYLKITIFFILPVYLFGILGLFELGYILSKQKQNIYK